MPDPCRNDLVFSEAHLKFVRFHSWADGAFARVMDRNSGEVLPDYVHARQLLTAADAARRARPLIRAD